MSYDPTKDPACEIWSEAAHHGDTCVVCEAPALWREYVKGDAAQVKVCARHSRSGGIRHERWEPRAIAFTNDGLRSSSETLKEALDRLSRCDVVLWWPRKGRSDD